MGLTIGVKLWSAGINGISSEKQNLLLLKKTADKVLCVNQYGITEFDCLYLIATMFNNVFPKNVGYMNATNLSDPLPVDLIKTHEEI